MPVRNFTIDYSLNTFKVTPEITKDCFNWCKDQHFAHNTNIEIEMLFLPAFALMSLIAYEFIKDTEYKKWCYNLIKLSRMLLIFFFALFFYRYYF